MKKQLRFRLTQSGNLFIAQVIEIVNRRSRTTEYEVTTTRDGDVLVANCDNQELGDAMQLLVTAIINLK